MRGAHRRCPAGACGRSLLVLPLGDARLRHRLRLGLDRPRAARLPGGGDDHDAGAVPARVPACRQRAGATSTPGLEEAARSLGLGPWRTFWRVTLRQIRPAVLGGCLLVTLALLAEYGAFEIVQYQTFTVEIFTEFKLGFDTVAACVLSLVLVRAERRRARRRAGAQRARTRRRAAARARGGPPARRAGTLRGARRWRDWARWRRSRSACRSARSSTGWCAAARRRCRRPRSLRRAVHTAAYSAAAAALATALAVPVRALVDAPPQPRRRCCSSASPTCRWRCPGS